MNRRVRRSVAVAFLFFFIAAAPSSALFGATRDLDRPGDVRERIVRVIKKIRNTLLPQTTDGEGITPPRP